MWQDMLHIMNILPLSFYCTKEYYHSIISPSAIPLFCILFNDHFYHFMKHSIATHYHEIIAEAFFVFKQTTLDSNWLFLGELVNSSKPLLGILIMKPKSTV